ncbi:MAG: hypothetical protein H8E85_02890 [Candidatus Marinimicrobia bacterium]|nr:hypothetical protein [Candidatus Neomarinimicrobiota bacterium]
MPYYSYECKNCNVEINLLRSFSSRDHASCPNCEKSLYRKFSSPSVSTSSCKASSGFS